MEHTLLERLFAIFTSPGGALFLSAIGLGFIIHRHAPAWLEFLKVRRQENLALAEIREKALIQREADHFARIDELMKRMRKDVDELQKEVELCREERDRDRDRLAELEATLLPGGRRRLDPADRRVGKPDIGAQRREEDRT